MLMHIIIVCYVYTFIPSGACIFVHTYITYISENQLYSYGSGAVAVAAIAATMRFRCPRVYGKWYGTAVVFWGIGEYKNAHSRKHDK